LPQLPEAGTEVGLEIVPAEKHGNLDRSATLKHGNLNRPATEKHGNLNRPKT
jgi:hypothetical protein